MGTKFRTLLAPINASTGDGRRFAEGAISLADLPMPIEWARSREGGHDGAVVIGAVQEAAVLTVADAIAGDWISADQVTGMDRAATGVWARGELFDAVDREQMPRLAEDVSEAMHLIGAGTLGPSVDLDSFEGQPVMAGTDDPIDFDALEVYYEEHGTEPPIELLITAGRVRAATLVSIPAFAETCRPLELIAPNPEDDDVLPEAEAALIASVGGGSLPYSAADFSRELTGPTPITYDEHGRVFGHIATWRTCHTGYADVCVTAPRDTTGGRFSAFNRFAVETDGGTIWAGRLTAGGNHAGLSLAASSAMSHHDSLTTVAYVRAYEDEHGIAVAGVLGPAAHEPGFQAILSRRKVSGDWRETPDGLSLIEVLALSPGPRASSEPGFPVETFSRAGRQVALTASLGPEPEDDKTLVRPDFTIDPAVLAREIVKAQQTQTARAALSSTLASDEQARRSAARAELLATVGEG